MRVSHPKGSFMMALPAAVERAEAVEAHRQLIDLARGELDASRLRLLARIAMLLRDGQLAEQSAFKVDGPLIADLVRSHAALERELRRIAADGGGAL